MKEQNKEVVQINEEKHDNQEKQVLIQGELNIPQQQEPVEQKEVLPARESLVAIRENTIDRVWQNMPEKAKIQEIPSL